MHARSSSRPFLRSFLASSLLIALVMTPAGARIAAQAPAASAQAATNGGRKAPVHAQAVKRLLITNAMVIYGNGKPPYGPMDILLQDGLIAQVSPSGRRIEADAVIDATGKYVMPGLSLIHISEPTRPY